MNSIDVDSSTRFSEVQGNLAIQVPSWARVRVPGNSTFDIQKAVMSACILPHVFFLRILHQWTCLVSLNPGRWTALQMILPVIAALTTLLLSGIVLLFYQRCHSKLPRRSNLMDWPKGLKRLHLHTSHKVVTTIDRDEAWEIDGPVANQPPFMDFALSSDDAHSRPVPVRASPYDSYDPYNMEMMDIHEPDKKSKTVTGLKSTTDKPPMLPRLPWKRRPPHITLVPATPHFRVDDVRSVFTNSGEAVRGRSEINVAVEEVDHVPPEIDETRSLITSGELAERDSQEVILISKDGRSFTLESKSDTVNSHIKIISPSVSSTSPRSVKYPVSAKVSSRVVLSSDSSWYLSSVDYIINSPINIVYHHHHLAMQLPHHLLFPRS